MVLTGILYVITFIYDLITLPFFYLRQEPWKKTQRHKEPKVGVNIMNS